MKINLRGRTALLTGSIQGLGFESAKTLALAGAKVVLNNHMDDFAAKPSAPSQPCSEPTR